MQRFRLDPRRWWLASVVSGNPLLRRVDRIEALVIMVAIVMCLVAVAVAGAVGTAVYDTRARALAVEAQRQHMVTATIIDARAIGHEAGVVTTAVQATWPAARGQATGSFGWDSPVVTGDRIDIWVDSEGNRVNPPPPAAQASIEAFNIAFVLWLGVVLATAALVAAVRWRLGRVRDARWEREIRYLMEGERGTWHP